MGRHRSIKRRTPRHRNRDVPALKFYVYVWRDARSKKRSVPIYVGKGNGYRAYAPHNANGMLQRIIRKHRELGLEPRRKIVARFATEAEAFAYEVILIAKYGRRNNHTGTLCNLTDGGEGTSGYKLTPRRRREVLKHWRRFHSSPKFRALIRRLNATGSKFQIARLKNLQALARDPKVQAKRRANFRKIHADPKFQARSAIRLRKLVKDPKRIANHLKVCTTEAFRQMIRDRWDDPKFKKRMSAIHKRNSNQPARRAKQSRVGKRNWQDPKLRKLMTAANGANARRLWADPQFRRSESKKRSRRMRRLMRANWRNPKWRAKYNKTIAARRAARARK